MGIQLSTEGVIEILLSIIGIGISIWLFYSEISKKLTLLLRTRRGELSKEQAKELSSIYVDYVVSEIHRKIDQVILDLNHHGIEDIAIVGKLLEYADEIKKSIYHIRGQTTEFALINGMTFKAFIEESHKHFSELIQEGNKKLENFLTDCLNKKSTVSELRTFAHKEIEGTGKVVKDIIKHQLQLIYR